MTHTLLLTLLAALPAAEAVQADFVLRGATIHDGSGQPPVQGDVAIRGERVVAVGKFTTAGKPRLIPAEGLLVAPGFIDLHTHSDSQIVEPATRPNLNYLTQGVTTIVTGNCGAGPVDVAAFYRKLDEHKAGSNVLHQVPHGAVRSQVMGNVNRPPTPKELEEMKDLVDRGMRDGAWGFCTGLIYNPGTYAKTDELIELAKVAARHGGIYNSHIRGEGATLLPAVQEAIDIGAGAGLPVHISHFKASGKQFWGRAADSIALVRQARAKGQVVTADQYPYNASSTSLTATLVPALFREGSPKELIERLDDPELGPKIRQAMEQALGGVEGAARLFIAGYKKDPSWQGKNLAEIAKEQKKEPIEIALEIERNGGASIVNFGMSEEDVRLIMKQPFVATASDGRAMVPGDTVPHPRSYGTFPRKIGLYSLADQVVPLEQALRSASGLPADILRLPGRGYLKPGTFADVVVFDPKTFRDTATFAKPHQYATGVRYLFVNGTLTIDDGKYNGALAGKAIRHQSAVGGAR